MTSKIIESIPIETKKDIFIFSYFLAPKYIENKIPLPIHKPIIEVRNAINV